MNAPGLPEPECLCIFDDDHDTDSPRRCDEPINLEFQKMLSEEVRRFTQCGVLLKYFQSLVEIRNQFIREFSDWIFSNRNELEQKKGELNLGIVNTHNWSLKESLCWLTERRNCILKPILYWRLGIKMNAKRKAGFKMIEQTTEDSKTESHRALTATTTTQPLFLFSLSVPDHCMVPKATGFPFYTHKPASRPSSPSFLPLHPSIHQPFYPLWRKKQEE